MNVVIQNVSTRRYLGDNGRWVRSESKARNFRTSLNAMDFCFKHQLFGVEIVLMFEERCYDIRLNVFPKLRGRRSRGRFPEAADSLLCNYHDSDAPLAPPARRRRI